MPKNNNFGKDNQRANSDQTNAAEENAGRKKGNSATEESAVKLAEDPLSRAIAAIGRASAWLSVLMIAGSMMVVILRYIFSVSAIALQEAVMYMHAGLFMLGAAWTLQLDEHVRIDIVRRRMSPRAQAWVDCIGAVFLLWPSCAVIGYYSLDYLALSWSLRERSSEADGLPGVYFFKTLIPLMTALLILQSLCSMRAKLMFLRNSMTPERS